jgi:hypothetical protein
MKRLRMEERMSVSRVLRDIEVLDTGGKQRRVGEFWRDGKGGGRR